jgi:hypothetical protein
VKAACAGLRRSPRTKAIGTQEPPVMLAPFRAEPEANPLRTPPGNNRI